MIVQNSRKKKNQSTIDQIIQSSSKVNKFKTKIKSNVKTIRVELQKQLIKLKIEKKNLISIIENMKIDSFDDEQKIFIYRFSISFFQQRFRFIQFKILKRQVIFVFDSNQNLSTTRINKTKKFQKLIVVKSSKIFDFIRNIIDNFRFNIAKILKLSLIMKIDQFLNKSNVIRQKLTLNMQRNIFRYKIKRFTKTEKLINFFNINASLIIAIFVEKESLLITIKIHENDEQFQFLMIIFWIEFVKLNRTLLNEKSIIELMNRRKLLIINSFFRIHIDVWNVMQKYNITI